MSTEVTRNRFPHNSPLARKLARRRSRGMAEEWDWSAGYSTNVIRGDYDSRGLINEGFDSNDRIDTTEGRYVDVENGTDAGAISAIVLSQSSGIVGSFRLGQRWAFLHKVSFETFADMRIFMGLVGTSTKSNMISDNYTNHSSNGDKALGVHFSGVGGLVDTNFNLLANDSVAGVQARIATDVPIVAVDPADNLIDPDDVFYVDLDYSGITSLVVSFWDKEGVQIGTDTTIDGDRVPSISQAMYPVMVIQNISTGNTIANYFNTKGTYNITP
jgi:hypothetical protein